MGVQRLKVSRRGQRAARFGARLEKSLCAYAAAAAASGVSLLALAPSAQARIVYTPANTNIPHNGGPVLLDLNHDGIADFSFSNRGRSFSNFSKLWLAADVKDQANAIWGQGTFRWSLRNDGPPKGGSYIGVFASALRAGSPVGHDKPHFQEGPQWLMAFAQYDTNISSTFGQWNHTQNRYLGMRFMIDGEVHYGWARFSVYPRSESVAILTGYAYETIPNKPIIAGKTKGPDVITLEPASLGRLAQGASGISAWREKK
jgi:hypothetical protein